MSYLKIKNLSSRVDNFLLDNVNLEIQKGEYFVLLGQSGSGKTKLLESIAGINESEGEILHNDILLSTLSSEKRDVGFVYQEFALFPNLDVKNNIKFAANYKKIEDADILFNDLVDFLKLGNLLDRRIDNLSGGEKQRVAIARALFSRPKILLLDEPLSAIDPTFRNSIMKSLKDIHKRYDLTTIHVTHNFREASYLADKIAIIINGKIRQVGSSENVLNKPENIDIAKFLGFKNIFPLELIDMQRDDKEFFSIDPNTIKVSTKFDLQNDYLFDVELEECMGIVDHYKIFVKFSEYQVFIKILKRDYEGCYAVSGNRVQIGFDEKDLCLI